VFDVGSRANYSSIKSAMSAINKHPKLKLQLVLGASALLDRYGHVGKQIITDGFNPVAEVFMLIEGETPTTMAKSTGVGLMELPTVFERIKPDIVLTVGDRFETMATTLAAAYMNIPIAHTMGGEVSGTIDESIRHAVTKFSHIHFPASQEAKERILKLGEREDAVYLVGCPRIDLVAEILNNESQDFNSSLEEGVGDKVDINKPFILVSQHPVTTEYGEGEKQITSSLKAVQYSKLPAIVLWPNADAGSDDIARGMRKWREQGMDKKMHFYKNLPVNHYIRLMKKTSCLVGNSSSGIREGAFIGTPVVNIGSRQVMRERGQNVIDVRNNKDDIIVSMLKLLLNSLNNIIFVISYIYYILPSFSHNLPRANIHNWRSNKCTFSYST
jgi:UDP-hydrolysing UDP-N-acetyl-D-glucosamine 2-epimerase